MKRMRWQHTLMHNGGDKESIRTDYNIYQRKLMVKCVCEEEWSIPMDTVHPGEEVAHMCPANCGRGVAVKWGDEDIESRRAPREDVKEEVEGTQVEAAALMLRTATALRHGSACECPDCYELVDAVDAWLTATQVDTHLSSPQLVAEKDKVKR